MDIPENEVSPEFVFDPDRRVPHPPSLPFQFQSYSSCLPPSLILALSSDALSAFTARHVSKSTDASYSSGSTFFLPACMEPRCGLEALAKSIFDHHTRDCKNFDPGCSGAEWWTQCIEEEDDIGVHWDGDYGMEVG